MRDIEIPKRGTGQSFKFYLSGPITGSKEYKEEFDKAQKLLAEFIKGNEFDCTRVIIVNPATIELPEGKNSYEDYIRYDLQKLLECDAIMMLPGWETSVGARAEHAVATALKFKIYYF